MVRFDAYTCTTQAAKVTDVVPLLFGFTPTERIKQGKGFHTFGERISVADDSGSEVASVSFGGRQEDRIMVEVKGERTPGVVERLRGAFPHRVTRVDSCVDFERPGAFEALLQPVMDVKHRHKLFGPRAGDWEMPEHGRTQYLGAPTSAVRARLYEKGKQPEYKHLGRFDLCRLEIQIRPAKEAKDTYSSLSALEVWGASRWTRELAESVLSEQLEAHPPASVWRLTERDRALRWMVKQYAPHIVSLASDLGSWECLGLTLREMVAEDAASRSKE